MTAERLKVEGRHIRHDSIGGREVWGFIGKEDGRVVFLDTIATESWETAVMRLRQRVFEMMMAGDVGRRWGREPYAVRLTSDADTEDITDKTE